MKNLFCVYAIAFLMALTTIGCKAVGTASGGGDDSGSAEGRETAIPSTGESRIACSVRDVSFIVPVVDPSVVQMVTPIGGVGAGGTEIVGRSYIHPKAEYEDIALPVRAPTDMRLIAVTHYIPPGAPVDGSYRSDWALTFEVGCDVSLSFYHIKGVVPSIEAQATGGIKSRSAPEPVSQTIEFKAGDIIGYYIRGFHSIAFDFIVNDRRVTNPFQNQRRYEIRRESVPRRSALVQLRFKL